MDSDLKPLPVNVRVGQAVETVGQAGKPKTITGFQTHTTPVLLGVRDRAEVTRRKIAARVIAHLGMLFSYFYFSLRRLCGEHVSYTHICP